MDNKSPYPQPQAKTAILALGLEPALPSLLAPIIEKFRVQNAPPQQEEKERSQKAEVDPFKELDLLNEEILSYLNLSWDNACLLGTQEQQPMIESGKLTEYLVNKFGVHAFSIIEKLDKAYSSILIGSPCINLLADFWAHIFRQAGFDIKVLVVVTNPLKVAQSLSQKYDINVPKCMRIWTRHYINISSFIAGMSDIPMTITSYDSLSSKTYPDYNKLLNLINGSEEVADDTCSEGFDILQKDTSDTGQLPSLVSGLKSVLDEYLENGISESGINVQKALTIKFIDICCFMGQVVPLRADIAMDLEMKNISSRPSNTDRAVFLHYHLFKNAGTSLDAVLKKNFRAAWVSREFQVSASGATIQEQVKEWILSEQHAAAFSSHTMTAPPPEIEGIQILPILFVRHPIDRLLSAYKFERQQSIDGYGANLAKRLDFKGYVRTRLNEKNDRLCRNFHTSRLAPFSAVKGHELQRALDAIETLPFIGIVEDFSFSIEKLTSILQKWHPNFSGFNVRKNVSQKVTTSLEGRLKEMRSTFGQDFYDELYEANAEDLELYNRALSLWSQR